MQSHNASGGHKGSKISTWQLDVPTTNIISGSRSVRAQGSVVWAGSWVLDRRQRSSSLRTRPSTWFETQRSESDVPRTYHYNGIVTELRPREVIAELYLPDGDVQSVRVPLDAFLDQPTVGAECRFHVSVLKAMTVTLAHVIPESEQRSCGSAGMTDSELAAWIDTLDV